MELHGIARRAAAVGAALAAAALVAGPAAADPGNGKGRSPGPDAGWTATTFDEGGSVLSVRRGTGPAPGRDEVGIASLGGCRSVDAWRNSYTTLGQLAYRFHQVKHWCWSFPTITSVDVGTYISDRAFTYLYRGVVGAHDYFYPLWDSPRGGHYSFRQGQVDNCLLHYGCFKTEYPSVTIWINADGWWMYLTGMA